VSLLFLSLDLPTGSQHRLDFRFGSFIILFFLATAAARLTSHFDAMICVAQVGKAGGWKNPLLLDFLHTFLGMRE
jgi:hypothetical protein